MTARLMRRSTIALGAGLAVAALMMSGCGGQEAGQQPGQGAGRPGQTIPAQTADPKLAAMVPDKVKADGKIVIAADASYAPNEFFDKDNRTIIGMDVDLGNAIAQKLGLKAEYQNSTFDGIIPGIVAGKYELGTSSFTINPDRIKQVDMVSYFQAGTSLATKKGNPKKIDPNNLCGLKVAVQKATVQVDDLKQRSDKCQAQGKPRIVNDGDQYTLQTDVSLAVVSGRADVMIADSPVVDWAVKQSGGQLEVLGQAYGVAPYGIVVPKGQGDYAKAVQGAVQALIADGTYMRILEKWGVTSGAVNESQINPAVQ